ncbi:hypothetical protein DICVIV_02435 [Dictyocaulus viviparus]|uniref:UBC core domain-containing protein n=1 Tax=Dictyocaulus viviparus TaxID=29172 RepID=A0A0D8YA22_DICVI|nr:hypothetical protein DICVIV_02435 [Dictyocaulus viviparus]
MEGEYESVSLVKPEIFVYRIPPLGTNRGHKAADWKLDSPDWTGRMKLVAIGKRLELRLEDKVTGDLYAKCPIEAFPGVCIEPVTDSSRYFVIRLKNDAGQTAFVGCGFADRGDSFDLNVALQDHFKYLEKSAKLEKEPASQPSLDLAFKEGQTISINLGKKSASGQSFSSRPRSQAPALGGNVPLLPPPPGSSTMRTREPPPQVEKDNSVHSLLLLNEPIDGIIAVPNDENILDWHYVIKGSTETPYEGHEAYFRRLLLWKNNLPA